MLLVSVIHAVSVTTLTITVTLVVKTAMCHLGLLVSTNLRSTTTTPALMKALEHLSLLVTITGRFSSQIFRHPDQSKWQESMTATTARSEPMH